jgi:hypothetical protein
MAVITDMLMGALVRVVTPRALRERRGVAGEAAA